MTGLWDQESSHDYFLRVYDIDKNEWTPCAMFPCIYYPGAMAALRIPKEILKTCKVLVQAKVGFQKNTLMS